MEQLFERIQQLHQLMTSAGVPYRIVGGMAVYIHVSERDPLRARLTAEVDAAIARHDLLSVIRAARKAGWAYSHTACIDMLLDQSNPRARSAIRLVFINERYGRIIWRPFPLPRPTKLAKVS